MPFKFHDQSPCGLYAIVDYGSHVVVRVPCGSEGEWWGESAEIILKKWNDCASGVRPFAIFDRPLEDSPEVGA